MVRTLDCDSGGPGFDPRSRQRKTFWFQKLFYATWVSLHGHHGHAKPLHHHGDDAKPLHSHGDSVMGFCTTPSYVVKVTVMWLADYTNKYPLVKVDGYCLRHKRDFLEPTLIMNPSSYLQKCAQMWHSACQNELSSSQIWDSISRAAKTSLGRYPFFSWTSSV